MIKKFILGLFALVFVLFFSPTVFAESEFATNYNVKYSVNEDGLTDVTESITLKNLTDRFYASNFSLTISAGDIESVLAFDLQGPLKTSVKKEGNKTIIEVNFNSQVVGLDKEYAFTLNFKTKDFADKQGKIWEVTIPRISVTEPKDEYNLTLSVPVRFGDPTSITPEPISFSESGGQLNLNFSKAQVENSGVLANFGSEQIFKYNLEFDLKNDNVLQGFASVPLPMNTNYQEVEIQKITPEPSDVTIDSDGNYLAWFNLKPGETLKVNVLGLAKLNGVSIEREVLTPEEISQLTKPQKYWDSNNPLIRAKLTEIFAGKNPQTTKEKAKLIFDYVINFLQYDQGRVSKGDFNRLGSLNALSSPNLALCSEFTDLFIALSRAAGIPAREIVGFAYSQNDDLRPKSFGSLLHAWPEYYDENFGWVMVDPTWQDTSGGVDYFNKMDLNHLALAIRGSSSISPDSTNNVSVKFSEETFNPQPKVELTINSKKEILAGLPASLSIKVKNTGAGILPSQTGQVSASKISFQGGGDFKTPFIPPYGNYSKTFNLHPQNLWESFQDIIVLKVDNIETQKIIEIIPFFRLRIFGLIILAVILGMLITYLGVFILHKKSQNIDLKKKL